MLAEKPWKFDAVLRLFLGVLIAFSFGGLLAGSMSHFTSSWAKGQSDFWQIVIGALFIELPSFGLIALFLRQHEINWQDAFGWNMCAPATAMAYGVLAAVLFLPAGWGLTVVSKFALDLMNMNPQDQMAVQELADPTLTVVQKAVIGIIAVVFAPIVEEALFRGILYPTLKRLGGAPLALWITSVLFALVHFNTETFVPLLAFSLLLIYLYEKFQNLLAPVVAHSLFNAVNFLTLIFQDQINRVLHLK